MHRVAYNLNPHVWALASVIAVGALLFPMVACSQPPEWRVYTIENSGLPSSWVRALAIDAQGHIWMGTDDGEVAKFDGVGWMVYTRDNSGLPGNNIRALVIDGEGCKWIGTLGGGLVKFDGKSWTVYTTGNSGLPDNEINALAIDGQGKKWIGTDRIHHILP